PVLAWAALLAALAAMLALWTGDLVGVAFLPGAVIGGLVVAIGAPPGARGARAQPARGVRAGAAGARCRGGAVGRADRRRAARAGGRARGAGAVGMSSAIVLVAELLLAAGGYRAGARGGGG